LRAAAASLGVSVAALAACGGGSSGGEASTGTMRLALTDAPACGYENVFVTIEKVRVHQSGGASDADSGWSELVLEPARRVDLLTLTNGVLSELGQMTLPTGKYTQLRLVLASNSDADPLANAVVPDGGSAQPLTTPSGQQSGLKMPVNIDVAADQMADVVIDVDACKSVAVTSAGNSGRHVLRPVVRVTPRYLSGALGHVDAALAGGSTMVSLQQSGAVVKATMPDATGKFTLAPVAPGTYDLVIVAPGRATAVVTDVVVSDETVTTLNTSAAAFAPGPSASATATGTVEPAENGSVRATQALEDGTQIEVAGGPVGGDGVYTLVLPVAAPTVAPWNGGGALAFQDDAGAAGQYTLEATSGTQTDTTGTLTFAAGATVTTPFTFP
jgi:hypothetical protein